MTAGTNHAALRADLPHHRLGERLLTLRRRHGLSARAAAAMAGIRRSELRSLELGRASVPPTTLARLAAAYGCSLEELLDERADRDVRVTSRAVEVGDAVRPLSPAASDEEILQQYLSAVYELRGVEPGSNVTLRDADLALLADVLGDTTDEIEARLVALIHCSSEEARAIRRALLRRRLALPAAGLVLGVSSMTPAAAASDGDDSPATAVVAEVEAEVADVVPSPEPPPSEPEPQPEPEPAPEPEPEPDEEDPRGEDWAELIPPLVIENPDA